jgi:hypothetical protein
VGIPATYSISGPSNNIDSYYAYIVLKAGASGADVETILKLYNGLEYDILSYDEDLGEFNFKGRSISHDLSDVAVVTIRRTRVDDNSGSFQMWVNGAAASEATCAVTDCAKTFDSMGIYNYGLGNLNVLEAGLFTGSAGPNTPQNIYNYIKAKYPSIPNLP